jgi:hypothetical protein
MGELRPIKPGLWHPGRRVNWWLVCLLAGLLTVWFVAVIALLRVLA